MYVLGGEKSSQSPRNSCDCGSKRPCWSVKSKMRQVDRLSSSKLRYGTMDLDSRGIGLPLFCRSYHPGLQPAAPAHSIAAYISLRRGGSVLSWGQCGTVQRGVAQFLHVHPTTICYGHPAMSADLGCGRARMLVAVPALWSTMYPLLAECRNCGL